MEKEPRIVYRSGFGDVPAQEELKNEPTTSELEAIAHLFGLMAQEWQEVYDDLQSQIATALRQPRHDTTNHTQS